MKKRWVWVALFVVTCLGVVTGWNWQAFQPPSAFVPTSFQQRQPSPPARPFEAQRPIVRVKAPAIDSERILADVEALSFKRHSEADRAQARLYIMAALEKAGWSPQTQVFEGGVNVFAERPGTDPDAGAILIGAHYDSVERSPGADDNATGVTAVLETARLLSAPTPRALRVAFFDLEEAGLLGSLAYAEAFADPETLRGALIMEMLGYGCYEPSCQRYPRGLPIKPPTDRGDFLAVIGDQGHMPLIDAFHRATGSVLPKVLSLPIPQLGLLTPDLLRSDHAPFWQKGVGAVMVTDTANFRTPHYHKETDIPANLNPTFFAGATQIVVNATADLLNGRDRLSTDAARPATGRTTRSPATPI